VDLGWRQVDGGIRVAVAVGHDGSVHELLCGDAVLRMIDRCEQLQGAKDQGVDAIRETIARWRDAQAWLPDWWADIAANLDRWEKPAKFVRLVRHWRENRIPGDDAVLAACEEWQKHDRHMWQWITDLRAKALHRRLDDYRTSNIPAGVLSSYTTFFGLARSAGIKVIPRWSYNLGYQPDTTLAWVLTHIGQLGPIWRDNADVIACLQAGFIGAWGEWHSSRNGLTTASSMRARARAGGGGATPGRTTQRAAAAAAAAAHWTLS
jgi:hypothetical protein